MKDKHGIEIKAGDILIYEYENHQDCLPVIEKNGVLGINSFGTFFTLDKTDLARAEIFQK